MAEEKLQINISANFDGKGAKEAEKTIKNIGEAAKSSTTGIEKLSKSIELIKLNSILELGKKVISVFKELGSVFVEGVDLNSQFEQMNTKLQSLIFTADKSANTDPFEKWRNSGAIAKNVLNELKNLASKTGFGSVDLSEAFASFYSTASAHLNTDEAVKVFEKLSYAAKISGADINTLKATLDNVGAGIVQTNNDFGRFLGSLGLGTEELKKAIAEGNYAELIINSLAPFQQASDMAGNSLKDLKKQFNASIDEIKQKAAEPIFDTLKEQLEELKNADITTLEDSLNSLGATFADLLKDNLTKQNLESLIEIMSAMINTVTTLTNALSGLSDILAPDAIFGEDAGVISALTQTLGKAAEGYNQIFKENRGIIRSIFGSKELKEIEQEVIYGVNRIKQAFEDVGAVSWGGVFGGFKDGVEVSIESVDKLRDTLIKRRNELINLQERVNNLSQMEYNTAVKDGTVARLESEIFRVNSALISLNSWEGIPKLQEEAQNAKALADETARLKMEEQTRLETYLKANEARFKNYEKTIERLMSEEEKLTAKLQDGISQREAIENAYNNKRAGISGEYDEKIRKSNQYNLSDSAKFALDMQQYTKSVLEAKKALEVGDLSGFERYLSLAKELSNAWADKSGKELKENEFDIVGIELYKKRLEELKALELSGTDEKEKKELAAHDEKMAQIQAELKATQDKIQAEKAFYDEYTLKAKELQALLNTDTNSEHNINLNDSEVKAKIAELQKDTHSTHTVHVKQVNDGGAVAEKKATGGRILGLFRRRRGKIAGHDLSGSDDVPALLTRGEFIQNVRAVDYYGADFMEALNRRKIPKGALPKLSSASLRSARNSPTGRFASFATGGLVLSKFDKSLMRKITDNDPQVQELAKKLHEQFMREAGNSISKRFEVAKKWKNMYPDYFSVTSQNISWDFVGLAKMLIAKGVGKNADIASLGRGALGAFSGGGLVNMPNLGSQSTKSIDKNVNLNLNFGGGNNFAVQSDEATAMALERYLKGLGC